MTEATRGPRIRRMRALTGVVACCVSLAMAMAGPAAASGPTDVVDVALWSGTGHVHSGWLPIATPGDRLIALSGPAETVSGQAASCHVAYWEDPSGLVHGMPFQPVGLNCDGALAHWSGACVAVRMVTLQLTCLPPDGAVVRADVAIVPSDQPENAPFVREFTFAGTIKRTTPLT